MHLPANTSTALAVFAAALHLAAAREVVFPPAVPNVQQQQLPLGSARVNQILGKNDVDISTSEFGGLTTYANLPYVHCLAAEGEGELEKYDIAVLGAPFDTGVTARPGARFGPTGIRLGSRRIAAGFAWSVYTHRNTFTEWAKVVDCGDAPLTFLDNTIALQQLDKAHKVVSGRKGNSTDYPVPRILTLGGDHTTTLSALRSTYKHWGAVSVIHFDSHLDTWDPEVLGGGISEYGGVNHGTFLHIAHEEGLIRNTSIHAGIRAPTVNKKYDLRHDRACGFHIITARELDKIGVQGVIEKLKARVGGSNVYISVDIDVLDPAYAPATGTAEVGGWTTRELLSILDGLEGLPVVGGDVVEVAPVYDNAGETTGLAAAEVAHSLISLMVDTPVKPASGH
ncbi:arginase family protein [Polychaeton citri CBS 116435]|uniref:Arginase family protein n=1 Tax=Polychaeton citri CBS 116435 TaxID=1314669 RepID=A0A9P4QAC0_9PEZI|nr:arginase family protein [Polychaeton citri CBS 116435]